MTAAEVKKLIQSCFPAGSEDIYDWNSNQANIGKYFTALGQLFKLYGTDIVDTLRAEINPYTCTQKIPDWEKALGLQDTPIAKFGTTAQRRNAVIAWLRQSGSFSLEDIRAVMQPYFLYSDPLAIQVLETDRGLWDPMHTYTNATALPIAPGGNGTSTVLVRDTHNVSPAGILATLDMQCTLDEINIEIKNDNGFAYNWGPGTLGTGFANDRFTLRTKFFAGTPIFGTWYLNITTGAGAFTLNSWSLFVVGLGRDSRGHEGLGSGVMEFAVVADPALLGTGYDLEGAQRALQRMKPAHVVANVVKKNGIGGGGLCAIPGDANDIPPETLPDRSIPC